MYHVYNTTGFILRSSNLGEVNKAVFVFTEELGLIAIHAQSARKITSKLRYSLKPNSFARFSFVRGKNSWRLIDAEEIFSFLPKDEMEKTKIFASVLSLVGRFVHGEEENANLFRELKHLAEYLKKEKFTQDELHRFETLSALKILSLLGYVGDNRDLAFYIKSPINKNVLEQFTPHRRVALREINRALKESHL